MMMYWAYGTDDQGEIEVVGPYDYQEQAAMNAEARELHNVHTVSGQNRQQAMQQIHGRPQRNMIRSDEALPALPVFPTSPSSDETEE
jgi:hypothetical protein